MVLLFKLESTPVKSVTLKLSKLPCYCMLNNLQVEIVKLKLDKDRRKILERKAKPKLADEKKGAGKHKEKDVKEAPMET